MWQMLVIHDASRKKGTVNPFYENWGMIYIGDDIVAGFWRVTRNSLGTHQYKKSRWEEKSRAWTEKND